MIDELHNLADTILGIDNLRLYTNTYSLVIKTDYTLIVKDSRDQIVKPIKVSRDNSYTYNLTEDLYTMECLDEENKVKFFEEIYVAKEMIGTVRTIEVI